MKQKLCDGCNNPRPIWKNHQRKRYCKQCWSCHSDNTPKPIAKSAKPLPKVSSKKAKQDRVYSTMRKVYLEQYSRCQAKLNSCALVSSEIHHKKGRGEYYLDTTTWLAVCRNCHVYIELHPNEAKELGLSESRLSNN